MFINYIISHVADHKNWPHWALYVDSYKSGDHVNPAVTQSPARHWTRPQIAVPPDACDCHVHVFEDPAVFSFSAGRLYTPGLATSRDLVELLDAIGVRRAVIVQPTPYGADNRCLVDALDRLAGRARGVVVLETPVTDQKLSALHMAGVRGIRVNLETSGANDPKAAARDISAAAVTADKMGWHVQIYASLAMIAALHDIVLDLPVPLVIDHFGRAQAKGGISQPGFDALLSLVTSGKIYVKLSAPYRISEDANYSDVDEIANRLITANSDRMLWGSDWPHPFPQAGIPRSPLGIEPFKVEDDGKALDRLMRWARTPDIARKILVDNPERLYIFQQAENADA